jgi:hypothetical protein
VVEKAKRLIPNAWFCSAELGSKRRTGHGYIEDQDEETIVAKLKALTCVKIKVV